jgi:hypothetical protein
MKPQEMINWYLDQKAKEWQYNDGVFRNEDVIMLMIMYKNQEIEKLEHGINSAPKNT